MLAQRPPSGIADFAANLYATIGRAICMRKQSNVCARDFISQLHICTLRTLLYMYIDVYNCTSIYSQYCMRNFYTAPLAVLRPQSILYGIFFTYCTSSHSTTSRGLERDCHVHLPKYLSIYPHTHTCRLLSHINLAFNSSPICTTDGSFK